MDWNESRHAGLLLWTLGGLPVCVVLAMLMGWLRTRGANAHSRRDRLFKAAAVGAGIYIASSAITLAKVIPLFS